MINKVFTENKNSLGEYLIGLGQIFKADVTAQNNIVRIGKGKGSKYNSILVKYNVAIKPIFQVILKDSGEDTVKILIPEHTATIKLKYVEYGGSQCAFEYSVPQRLLKLGIDLKAYINEFDTAAEILNDAVKTAIEGDIKSIFNGKVFDVEGEFKLTGDVDVEFSIYYDTK